MFHPYSNPTQVDDDQRYGPLLLESLLRAMGPAPGRAIGAATQHPGSGFFVFFWGKTPLKDVRINICFPSFLREKKSQSQGFLEFLI